MTYKEYALCCKALGDETRAEIFDMLKSGKLCACKILDKFKITQPTLSYHMKNLTDCNLVNCEKDGKWCRYTINEETLEALSLFIGKPVCCCGGGSCEKK